MKILTVGDIKKVICNECGSFQQVTFKLRDVPFSDNSGVVKNVLAGVCDCCDSVAVIPHQSTPVIKKQLEVQRRESVEVRVPAHMIDILNLASYETFGDIDFSSVLIKFYIHQFSKNEFNNSYINSICDSDLFNGKAQKRLSIKGRNIRKDLDLLKKSTKITKNSTLLKGVILKINDDLLVNKNEKSISLLNNIMASTN